MGSTGGSATQDSTAHLQGSHYAQPPGLAPGIEWRSSQKPRYLPHSRRPKRMIAPLQLSLDNLPNDPASQ